MSILTCGICNNLGVEEMNLMDNLIKYTEYSKGNISKKCSLEYQDIDIAEFDFSKFDLNNSLFLGVNFFKCDFTSVYLSGSNFGGSFFQECVLKENVIRKAYWDDVVFQKTKITLMNAFRTTFMYGNFQDSDFYVGHFENCFLMNSNFQNVNFIECTMIDTDFSECKFDNVQFIKCKLQNVKFDEDVENQVCFID